MLALHKATGESWEAVQREATAVRDAATALIPVLANTVRQGGRAGAGRRGHFRRGRAATTSTTAGLSSG